jgi:hypothetical protein
MPRTTVAAVEFRGVKKYLARLNALPAVFRAFVDDAITYGEGEARRGARPHNVDRGELADSIKSSIDSDPVPGWARIATNKLYAVPMEYGRKPGRFPPVDVIEEWAVRHGYGEGKGFIFARAIARKGTRPLRFIRGAMEKLNQKLPQLIRHAEGQLVRTWRR